MRIDCHVHLSSPDLISNWKEVAKEEAYFGLLSNSKVNRFANADDIIKYLDKNEIDKAVVFGFAFEHAHNIRLANEYVIESVKKYPDRLIGFGVVNPNQKNLSEEIDFCLEANLKGFGELFPTGQKFDIADYNTMAPLVRKCMEYDIPLLIHANEPIGHYYPGKTDTTLNQLLSFSENFPDQKIIYAHFGGGLLFYELMPEIKEILKNSYYDTAAAPYLYDIKIYSAIQAMDLNDKLFFGSDFPLPCAEETIDKLMKSELVQSNLDKVFGQNLLNIL